jgi:TonB-dependent receptor
MSPMITRPTPSLWRRLCAALSLTSLLASSALLAQTGVVTGRVSDGATGKSLQGAVVRVRGSTVRDVTDADGRYALAAVPAGRQTLSFDYVGLDPLSLDVDVPADASVAAHAKLFSQTLKMATFAVTESLRGQALAANQQKNAAGIVNIVSEETFGEMIGGNIGYALQRLPGLTVNEDEDGSPSGVNIRGLEAKYNSVQIDGNRLPTSDNTRGFSTGQLSGDGIANIEVVKAPTPDRDGDAIGGIINLTSRSAFQRDGRSGQVTAAGLYYDKTQKWGHQAKFTYSDLVDVFGGTKNLGISVTASTYETSRDFDNLDKDYSYLTPTAYPALGLSEPVYFHTNGTIQTNFRDSASWSGNLNLDYRLTDRATFYLRVGHTAAEVETTKPRTRYYIASGSAIAAATANTGSGKPTSLSEMRYYNQISERENTTQSLSFGGKHELDTIVFTYDAFLSRNDKDKDYDFYYYTRHPGYSIRYDQTVRHEPIYTITNGKSPTDNTTISRGDLAIYDTTGGEDASSVKADWEKKFAGQRFSGSFKVGAKYRVNEKSQDENEAIYRTGSAASGFPYASFFHPSSRVINNIPFHQEIDIHAVRDLFNTSPNLFPLQSSDTLSNNTIADFEAEEDIGAAYVMGTLAFNGTRLIGGLRVEQNKFASDTYLFNEDAPAAPTKIRAERDYTVWLPGLHLRHELRKNLIARASYNRSYARPDIDVLVAGLSLDPETGNMSGGNPNLKETTSNNFDAQLEYYTAKGGLYSAGVFYKDMKGFYYERTFTFSRTDADGYPIYDPAGDRLFETVDNALGAVNYGVELIARQNLYFLPAPLDGFSVSLSATFTESDGKYPGRLNEDLPTYGFSDKIYYAALEYARHKFRAQLSYRYRSDYLEGLDTNNTLDDWFGANESVDWESSYQLTPGFKVFLNVNNLTDEPQISYQGFRRTDNPEDYSSYSWRATMGATYSF